MTATYDFCPDCSIPIITIDQETFERIEISTDRKPEKSLRFVTIEGDNVEPAKIFIPHVCQPLKTALQHLHKSLVRTLRQAQTAALNIEDLEHNIKNALEAMTRDHNAFHEKQRTLSNYVECPRCFALVDQGCRHVRHNTPLKHPHQERLEALSEAAAKALRITEDQLQKHYENIEALRCEFEEVQNDTRTLDDLKSHIRQLEGLIHDHRRILTDQSQAIARRINCSVATATLRQGTSTTMKNAPTLTIATDGSARSNGNAAWAYVTEKQQSRSQFMEDATNNQAELSAMYAAIDDHKEQNLIILSDSEYSIKALTTWAKKWSRNGWVTANGTPVKNKELISEINQMISERTARGLSTEFQWVKGHADHALNNAADKLAQETSKGGRSKAKKAT